MVGHLNVTKLITILQKITKNMKPMTKFMDLRGAKLTSFHLGSVLLSEQEDGSEQ